MGLKLIFSFLISLATSEAGFCQIPSASDTLNIYPSPRNCSNFVACLFNEEYEFDCLKASLFIPWTNDTLCVKPCPSVATTRRKSSKSVSQLPPDPVLFPDTPSRTIVCPPNGVTKAVVPNSCIEYISCSDGEGTKLTCPAGEEFSPSRYECVPNKISDCPKQKLKATHHSKCRFARGTDLIYFKAGSCPVFKKCANQMAWDVKCARYCHWNDDQKTCDWADSFNCQLMNEWMCLKNLIEHFFVARIWKIEIKHWLYFKKFIRFYFKFSITLNCFNFLKFLGLDHRTQNSVLYG